MKKKPNPIIQLNDPFSTYNHSDYGPSFAEDIVIANNSNINKDSFSRLGRSYSHPIYAYGTTEAQTFLAGSNKFLTSEIEVYKIME